MARRHLNLTAVAFGFFILFSILLNFVLITVSPQAHWAASFLLHFVIYTLLFAQVLTFFFRLVGRKANGPKQVEPGV